MFKPLIMMSLFLSQVAFSGTFSSLKWDRIVSPYGRAEYQVVKFNPSRINWGKEINQMKRAHSSTSCGPAIVGISRQEALKALSSFYQEDQLAEVLNTLVRRKKIVKAIYGHDGDQGESEYCSTATMQFYSIDGEILVLSFDFNT